MVKRQKERLDVLLVERGLAESRELAQRLIRAGEVRVDGQLVDQPGARPRVGAEIAVRARPRFVGRGGEKLDAALVRFGVNVEGMVAADIGASTGGFTDCLLQRGARRVYAIDVGYGQLAWHLRNDPRIVVMERTNARTLERLAEPPDLVTIDVSFISLRLLLPVVVGWFDPLTTTPADVHVLALLKPQFEAQRWEVEKGGVVRDARVHRTVLERILAAAESAGLALRGLMASPLRGPAGNVEFLAWWQHGGEGLATAEAIAGCLEEATDA
jgi:23S rRNA (cytidine1920-2'-O)/16S rRNA (cytidine1409-2'-O)-methyltransferase